LNIYTEHVIRNLNSKEARQYNAKKRDKKTKQYTRIGNANKIPGRNSHWSKYRGGTPIGQNTGEELPLVKIPGRNSHWSTEKIEKDKQRSTKHTYKTKDRVTRIPLKTGGALRKGKQFLFH
jgi:hypothetical protein